MFRKKEYELVTVISPMHTNPQAKTHLLSQERTPFALIFLTTSFIFMVSKINILV